MVMRTNRMSRVIHSRSMWAYTHQRRNSLRRCPLEGAAVIADKPFAVGAPRPMGHCHRTRFHATCRAIGVKGSPVPVYTRSGAEAVAANGSHVKTRPMPHGYSARGIRTPDSNIFTAFRIWTITQMFCPKGTINDAWMKSIANPADTGQTHLIMLKSGKSRRRFFSAYSFLAVAAR